MKRFVIRRSPYAGRGSKLRPWMVFERTGDPDIGVTARYYHTWQAAIRSVDLRLTIRPLRRS